MSTQKKFLGIVLILDIHSFLFVCALHGNSSSNIWSRYFF